MRHLLSGVVLFGLLAMPAVALAASKSGLVMAISLDDLADTLNSGGLAARIENIEGEPIIVTDLRGAGVEGYVHIAGLACNGAQTATDTTTPCQVLEFAAVITVPSSLSDDDVAAIDRKFELSSVERVDATHVVVTDGMVLIAGVMVNNIAANIGFFAGQASAILEELNTAGRSV
jgi:hypothetical protein